METQSIRLQIIVQFTNYGNPHQCTWILVCLSNLQSRGHIDCCIWKLNGVDSVHGFIALQQSLQEVVELSYNCCFKS